MANLYIWHKFFFASKDKFPRKSLIKSNILIIFFLVLQASNFRLNFALSLWDMNTNKYLQRVIKLTLRFFVFN